jgi:hypothetical protein
MPTMRKEALRLWRAKRGKKAAMEEKSRHT